MQLVFAHCIFRKAAVAIITEFLSLLAVAKDTLKIIAMATEVN